MDDEDKNVQIEEKLSSFIITINRKIVSVLFIPTVRSFCEISFTKLKLLENKYDTCVSIFVLATQKGDNTLTLSLTTTYSTFNKLPIMLP